MGHSTRSAIPLVLVPMEILSVSLTNFKAHSDRHFVFQPGTNAICGENGAGKTSILEAVAWALFDHRGSYRVEDLVRNGATTAQVRVQFISSRDHRTYEVQRCTKAGYTIYDPQLGQKLNYTRIKEEVLPWLRQHLGVSPGTNLADLFANTIGVPQGMFTADFLLEPSKRKATFDQVLKVEEYQKTYKELNSLEKHAKAETEHLSREIEQYQTLLQDWDGVTTKYNNLNQEIQTIQQDLNQCNQQLERLQEQQQQAQQQVAALQTLNQSIDRSQAQAHTYDQLLEQRQQELNAAQKAVDICTVRREPYRLFQEAEQALQVLEQQRSRQQLLLQNKQTLIQASSDRQARLATISSQLDRCHAAEQTLANLAPLIDQQLQLEAQQQEIHQKLQACQTGRQTQLREQKRLNQLHQRRQSLQTTIEQLRSLADAVAAIPQLEEQQTRYQQQLSRIAAATQFETDLRQIVGQADQRGHIHSQQLQTAEGILDELLQAAPLWANPLDQVRSTLQAGVHIQAQLRTDLQDILEDLAEQVLVDRLQHHLQEVQQALQKARQQQAQFLTLPSQEQTLATLDREIAEVQHHLQEMTAQFADEPNLQTQIEKIQGQLNQLDDPRGRSRLLQQEIQKKPQLQKQLQELQKSLESTATEIATIDTELASYTDLADQIQQQQVQRETYRSDYTLYLKNRELANSYRQRYQELETTKEQLNQITEQIADLESQKQTLTATFDPQQAIELQAAYQAAQTQQAKLSAQLPLNAKLLEEYAAQLQKLETLRSQLATAQTELKQKQRVERFIKFARKAYKEAGPRITERYVQNISREADRLFRELLNRPNVALQWTRDYEIIVREGANDRRFVNLSGGEQMCAAMAVRLALLKVLADINIAFFDEPTTNMDRLRRVRLAEAIANIKTFRQLFVISHDDTFEQVTENVIFVQRE